MKYVRRKKFACVREESAEEFEERMNEILAVAGDPEIVYPQGTVYVAYIEYVIERNIPETISDRYEIDGKPHMCGECPYLEWTADRRRKTFPCKHSEYGISRIEKPACDKFYIDLEKGVIDIVKRW